MDAMDTNVTMDNNVSKDNNVNMDNNVSKDTNVLHYLEKLNPVPQFDSHIVFVEDGEGDDKKHDYYVDGRKYDGSCTGFVHGFFSSFDPDKIIRNMTLSKSWKPGHKYWGMTPDQIKAQWKDSNKDAAPLGTAMHAKIEKFYNIPELYNHGQVPKELLLRHFDGHEIDSPDFQQFLRYHADWPFPRNWVPFRTELRVFDREMGLPGSVDMLYWSPNSQPGKPMLNIVDWKRAKEIHSRAFYSKEIGGFPTGTGPCSTLSDCTKTKYSLQINMYAAMIERNTEYRIDEMYLAVFHPIVDEYRVYHVDKYHQEIGGMMHLRIEQQNELRQNSATNLS